MPSLKELSREDSVDIRPVEAGLDTRRKTSRGVELNHYQRAANPPGLNVNMRYVPMHERLTNVPHPSGQENAVYPSYRGKIESSSGSNDPGQTLQASSSSLLWNPRVNTSRSRFHNPVSRFRSASSLPVPAANLGHQNWLLTEINNSGNSLGVAVTRDTRTGKEMTANGSI